MVLAKMVTNFLSSQIGLRTKYSSNLLDDGVPAKDFVYMGFCMDRKS